MPEVSVIIPTYNRWEFLNEAVESVLNQTYRDFELIVVDDGSTDTDRKILDCYSGEIKVIYQTHSGVSKARNTGIHAAQGNYITFLDSDDLWNYCKLEKQIQFFSSNQDYQVCYSDEIWIRNGKRVNPGKKHRKYSGWIFEYCLPLCIISPSSVMIKGDVFDEVGLFDESLPACEDYDLWLRISAKYPIYFLEEPLITKRGGHRDQLSHQFWGNDRFRIVALQKILSDGSLSSDYRHKAISVFQEKCLILMSGCKKRGKLTESNYYQSLIHYYDDEKIFDSTGSLIPD